MKLKEARKAAGKTMQDVADELGITRQTYSKMEHDADLITLSDAKKISKFLDTPLSEIFLQ